MKDRTRLKAAFYLVRLMLQKLIGLLLYLLGAGLLLTLSAGIYFAFLFAATLVSGLIALRLVPETLAARGAPAPSPLWDKILLGILLSLNYFGVYLVAGLCADGSVIWWLFYAGMALCAGAGYLTLRALLANPHLESTARIQTERGHTVCSTGPYARVRHPAYLGMLINCAGMCAVFQSLGVLLCACVITAAVVARTCLEDRMLRAELEGYAEYAEEVRYLLIPRLF